VVTQAFYALDGGDLRISRDDPPFEWRGRFDGLPVEEVQPLGDGEAALVLLEAPPGWKSVQNLLRVTSGAEIQWRGELPWGTGGADRFVEFSGSVDGDVTAWTFSCYRVTLSGESGRLLTKVFTK
jgi:hypothetical protein